jgi:hypothetical protein
MKDIINREIKRNFRNWSLYYGYGKGYGYIYNGNGSGDGYVYELINRYCDKIGNGRRRIR